MHAVLPLLQGTEFPELRRGKLDTFQVVLVVLRGREAVVAAHCLVEWVA